MPVLNFLSARWTGARLALMVAVLDTSKFVSMADERIASVESDGNVLRVGVIAGRGDNPVITGYSERPIQFVRVTI
jgi:hypothetical protein